MAEIWLQVSWSSFTPSIALIHLASTIHSTIQSSTSSTCYNWAAATHTYTLSLNGASACCAELCCQCLALTGWEQRPICLLGNKTTKMGAAVVEGLQGQGDREARLTPSNLLITNSYLYMMGSGLQGVGVCEHWDDSRSFFLCECALQWSSVLMPGLSWLFSALCWPVTGCCHSDVITLSCCPPVFSFMHFDSNGREEEGLKHV